MQMRWAFLCALAAATGLAQSADETGKWYLNPQVGYLWTDSDRNVDDDVYYSLGLGKHLSREWSLELNGGAGAFDGPAGDDLDIITASLDGLRVFRRASRVSPFVTVGVGYINDDPDVGGSEKSLLAQAGAGLLIDAAENSARSFVFQLRPEAKARWDFINEGPNHHFVDYMLGLGLVFAFGASRPVEPATKTAAPPPAPLVPEDSDADGVPDQSDQCPDTPRGTAVDAAGCPLKGLVTLHGVTFEFDSATLTPASRPILDEVAADLAKHPRLKVELQGHTDSVGPAAYNLELSRRRADAVLEYLVSQGVVADQLTAQGYGETQPVADNAKHAGRALNRRVVMRVTDNPGEVETKGEGKSYL